LHSPLPPTQPLATTNVLPISMDLSNLYKWVQICSLLGMAFFTYVFMLTRVRVGWHLISLYDLLISHRMDIALLIYPFISSQMSGLHSLWGWYKSCCTLCFGQRTRLDRSSAILLTTAPRNERHREESDWARNKEAFTLICDVLVVLHKSISEAKC
jgi:hypothetical protein